MAGKNGFYANDIKTPKCPICLGRGWYVKKIGWEFQCSHVWDWKSETQWGS